MQSDSTLNIRWMLRRDMPSVQAIEDLSFECPWKPQDFVNALRCRNSIGFVVEDDDLVILGFVIYRIYEREIEIVNIAVHPQNRRQGVATAMVAKLYSKLASNRRNKLRLHVRDANLDAQLLFKRCGFVATQVSRGHYDTGDDAYEMVRKLSDESRVKRVRI